MINHQVRDWMTPHPITVSSNCTLHDAYRLMMDRKIRRLLVVDESALVGVVTLEDLRRQIPDRLTMAPAQTTDVFRKLTVREIMTTNPKTIPINTTLLQAAQIMLDSKISTLPVMNGTRLVGIITESDIFKALVKVIVIQ